LCATQPLAVEDSSKGGVLLPESAKEKPATGMVLAVGPGGKKDKMKLKVGDKVVFFKYAGEKMKARTGKMYVMLRQGDIFGSLN
jgi:chaperonin GroES